MKNKGGNYMEKMTLEQFKIKSPQEQVDLVNQWAEGKKTLKEIEKEYLNFTNLNKHLPDGADWISKRKKVIYEPPLELSQDEIKEIKDLLAARREPTQLNRYPKDDEIKNRSILVYKAAYDEFAAWAKEHKLTQAEALYLASQKLMQEYDK